MELYLNARRVRRLEHRGCARRHSLRTDKMALYVELALEAVEQLWWLPMLTYDDRLGHLEAPCITAAGNQVQAHPRLQNLF